MEERGFRLQVLVFGTWASRFLGFELGVRKGIGGAHEEKINVLCRN